MQWLIFREPLTISSQFLENFIGAVGPGRKDGVPSQAAACDMPDHPYCTYRAEQPLNGRPVREGQF